MAPSVIRIGGFVRRSPVAERSRKPSTPSARKRLTHLPTVVALATISPSPARIQAFHAGYRLDSITGFARHGGGGTDVIDLNRFGLNFTTLQPFMADVGGYCVITINAVRSVRNQTASS
jgi:hypothetical protein